MSNVEARPDEIHCHSGTGSETSIQVLSGREVPLGGPRSMLVRRTLPHRERSFIGAWCFVDHYGPADIREANGMDVPPHPHTGLQTVSWLFEGEIEHRDSGGEHGFVRPGEVNLMTGGRGIAHSEVSTPSTAILHGLQLWVALPEADADAPRQFTHHAPERIALSDRSGCRIVGGEAHARVFIGSLAGETSPVPTYSPLLGVEITMGADATLVLEVRSDFEHGVLVDTGEVAMEGVRLGPADLGCRDAGAKTLRLRTLKSSPARIVLLGGEPFAEEIVMWWNFVGRSHEEIERFRTEWQNESDRFGQVEGYQGTTKRLPAPPLPGGTLKARNRHGRRT
ncbi:pirin family protein [Natronoglycomyces albus]|uniref:Pirin family protein n=1 Tax=Natronoglycomyces albus TaxID=2811108 RepID=A0A895XJG4_9ACTN|nr:pirin family protein [Natronoglycomyces albus]QSB03952.1 pirin family protein [Natronoglycomyces albus]